MCTWLSDREQRFSVNERALRRHCLIGDLMTARVDYIVVDGGDVIVFIGGGGVSNYRVTMKSLDHRQLL